MRLPPFAAACQGLALLALEGLSLGLALAEVALWPRLPAYVGRNEIAPGARIALLVAMAAGAALLSARGAWLLRPDPVAGAYAVRALARRLAPLALAALAPLVVHIAAYRIWVHTPGMLALTAALVAVYLALAWAHRESFAPLIRRPLAL